VSEHGTISRYTNDKCRCDDCRAAHRRYSAKRRAQRRELLQDDPTLVEHGRLSTYLNWGCRCTECTEANWLHKIRWMNG